MLNISTQHTAQYRCRGFSLVEMMLAMLIGIIITGGVMSLYINTRDAQRSSDDQLQMVADARFVIDTLGYDIRHAGSWGGTAVQSVIDCRFSPDAKCSFGDTLPLATGDCAPSDYINLDRPIFGADDSNPYGSTCATMNYRPNTDILQARYADSTFVTTAAVAKDTAYIRANSTNGKLFVASADGTIPDHDGNKWESPEFDYVTKNYPLVSHVFYVSTETDPGDGIPSLRRVTLDAGPLMNDEVIVSGVEDLQVQYGIVDPVANPQNKKTVVSYVNASAISCDLDWQKVSAIKIFVLMRSEKRDRDGIQGNRTFTYAGKTADETDGYRRFLISSVIELRNTIRLDELSSGQGGCP
jgi:type IV pilus assembly protein PilW